MNRFGNPYTIACLFILSIPLFVLGQNAQRRIAIGTGYVIRIVNQPQLSASQPAFQLDINAYLNPSFDLQLLSGINPGGFDRNPSFKDLADLDLAIRYKLYNGDILPFYADIGPYFMTGISAHQQEWDGSSPDLTIPAIAGIKLFSSTSASIDLRAAYKMSLSDSENYWTVGATVSFHLGKYRNDQDKDGVPDEVDNCPQLAGLSGFEGCPDSDKDGVPDQDDQCPFEAGLIRLQGCPENQTDSDQDGILDVHDKCPNLRGDLVNSGCPDSDSDGVVDPEDPCPQLAGNLGGCPDSDSDGLPDPEDYCPNAPGSSEYNGCPDLDGDGIIDKEDKCPQEVGIPALYGCPKIDDASIQIFKEAQKTIKFATGSANLLPQSFSTLDEIATIMLQYEGYKLRIVGHTDSQGDATFNQLLSEKRARKCATYLITRGIQAQRLTFMGMGETNPITDNIKAAGREKNRRVEFELYID